MKILIAGDYCPQGRVANKIEKNQAKDVLEQVVPYVHQSDYSIVNFECTLAPADSKPITKSGPNLSCSKSAVDLLKNTGFQCCTLANNHSLDFGQQGLLTTMDALRYASLDYVGAGSNLQSAQKPIIKSINGQTCAFINCCEQEFSIATPSTAGANPLDIIAVFNQIKQTREKVDFVVVIVHGGNEFYPLPSPRMQSTYRFFVEAGADAVINHHQHCFSGYETYRNKPIFYGLGNFCFDATGDLKDSWYKGYMVELDMQPTGINFQIIPYHQCQHEAAVCIASKAEQKEFTAALSKLNAIIANPDAVRQQWSQWVFDNKRIFKDSLPRLYRLLPPKFVAVLLNRFQCDTHRDAVVELLSQQLYESKA